MADHYTYPPNEGVAPTRMGVDLSVYVVAKVHADALEQAVLAVRLIEIDGTMAATQVAKLAVDAIRALKVTPAPASANEHIDDDAVDAFAAAMKDKLADARRKGRSRWFECDPSDLSRMLREHVEKGDPRDVANFCMFLWSLGKPITSAAACATCKGSGVVPDGEITGSGGVAYENGPVQCVKDCPSCTPAAAPLPKCLTCSDHGMIGNMLDSVPCPDCNAPAAAVAYDESKALDLLATMFDAYENGPACYDDPEESAGYLGNAVRLDNDDFQACAELLNRRRPRQDAIAAAAAADALSATGSALKSAYVKMVGSDDGWQGERGSWFVEGYLAAQLSGNAEQVADAQPVAWMDPDETCVQDAFLWRTSPQTARYRIPVFTAQPAAQAQPADQLRDAAEGLLVEYRKRYTRATGGMRRDAPLLEQVTALNAALHSAAQPSGNAGEVPRPILVTRTSENTVMLAFASGERADLYERAAIAASKGANHG